MLKWLNKYANDRQRLHETWNIWHHSFIIITLCSAIPGMAKFWVWVFLITANQVRVTIQEVGNERNWDWRKAFDDPDFYYDWIVRPIGTQFFSGIALFLPVWTYSFMIPIGFIITYKYGVFNRK